ncbi:MAG: hypothetical protein IJ509_03905 [Bacilli bacterium]|nr:hypothetical protein [Bacilli bacterium]
MIKCEALVKALTGNYDGSYYEFEKEIIKFVESYMSTLCKETSYSPNVKVEEKISADGITVETDKIIFNKKLIKSLMSGQKLALIAIFHELSHIEQNIQIKNGISTPNIIRYIKDILLNEYQDKENRQFSMCARDTNFSYYKVNYKNESSEIDANLDAILLTIQFFLENNIDYTREETYLMNYFDELIERKSQKRNLTHCITFNSYYLTLDEAFDVAIKYHPEWLERYPQLKVEYRLINGSVLKKSEFIYQEYNESSSIYHKIKRLVK